MNRNNNESLREEEYVTIDEQILENTSDITENMSDLHPHTPTHSTPNITDNNMTQFMELMKNMMQELRQDINKSLDDLHKKIDKSTNDIHERIDKNTQSITELRQELKLDIDMNIDKLRNDTTEDMINLRNEMFDDIDKEAEKQSCKIRSVESETSNALDNQNIKINKLNEKVELVTNNKCEQLEVELDSKCVERSKKHRDELNEKFDTLNKQIKEVDNKLSKMIASKELVDNNDMTSVRANENYIVKNAINVHDNLRDKTDEVVSERFPKKHSSVNAELILIDFDDRSGETHPMCFLELAEKYVKLNTDPWEAQSLCIFKYLKGEAGHWARIYLNKWENFEAFASAFKRKYWSMAEQKRFENLLMGNGYFVSGKHNLTTYVMRFFNENNYLDSKLDNRTFLAYVSKHVPKSIGSAIAAANINNAEELEMLLTQLTELDTETNRHRMQRSENRSRDERQYSPRQINTYNDNRERNEYRSNKPRVEQRDFNAGSEARRTNMVRTHDASERSTRQWRDQNSSGSERGRGSFMTGRGRGYYHGGTGQDTNNE